MLCMKLAIGGIAMRLIGCLFMIAVLMLLAGCPGQIPVPRETITFVYKFAEQQTPGVYTLQVLRGAPDPANCANQVQDRMTLAQVAFTVQRLGDPSLVNVCHDRFSVDVASARTVSRNRAKFEFHPLSGTTDRRGEVIADNEVSGSSFPRPSRIHIVLNGAIVEGVKTTDGVAEIILGASGPVYRCESSAGEDFWDDHIGSERTDTFLEFTLTSYDPGTRGLGAQFQCLARNANDSSDNRLLLVMLGSVFITAEN